MSIIGVVFGVMLASAASFTGNAGEIPKEPTAQLYADCGAILEEPGKDVIITMQNGNQFSFENVDGDWMKGDLVSAIFDDNGTENVEDDEIISYQFSGWITENEQKNWIK